MTNKINTLLSEIENIIFKHEKKLKKNEKASIYLIS
jgi:hypothetical protein